MAFGACQGLAAAALFFFFVVCVLSIVSTSMPDWWWWLDPVSGVHEGLWASCLGKRCGPAAEHYTEGCLALLNVVRAFSVMTIIFSFFAALASLLLAFCICGAAPLAFLFATLTTMFSIIPWAVYLGFLNQCVPGASLNTGLGYPYDPGFTTLTYPYSSDFSMDITKGSGWSLAVSACPLAFVGLFLLLAWCLRCYRPAPLPVAAPCPMPCPMPCPCPLPCPSPCMMPCSSPCMMPCPPPCPCPCPCPISCPSPCLPPAPVGQPVACPSPLCGPAYGMAMSSPMAGADPYAAMMAGNSGMVSF